MYLNAQTSILKCLRYSRGIGQVQIRVQNETVTKRLPRPSLARFSFSVISTETKHHYVYFRGFKMKPNVC